MPNGHPSAGPTAGELIYAVGDIHGGLDLLHALLDLIERDWRTHDAHRRPLLVFVGDYVDRGPRSAQVLDALIALQARDDIRTCFLEGNHEQSFQRFLADPSDCERWLRFGGVETLASYGVDAPSPYDAEDCRRARDRLRGGMPASHLSFLAGLERMRVVGDYAFVHAGVRPGVALADQDEDDLLWIRREFLDHPGRFEKVIVHGHTWTGPEPQVLPQRIGVDTGAYATGVLTAARLDGADVAFLQARREMALAESA